jgi:hypothetical protein
MLDNGLLCSFWFKPDTNQIYVFFCHRLISACCHLVFLSHYLSLIEYHSDSIFDFPLVPVFSSMIDFINLKLILHLLSFPTTFFQLIFVQSIYQYLINTLQLADWCIYSPTSFIVNDLILSNTMNQYFKV